MPKNTKRSKLCHFHFVSGWCRNGDSCRFSHRFLDGGPGNFCMRFSRFKCKKENCKNPHYDFEQLQIMHDEHLQKTKSRKRPHDYDNPESPGTSNQSQTAWNEATNRKENAESFSKKPKMTFSFGRADDDEISEIQVVAAVVSGTPLKFKPVADGFYFEMQGGVQTNALVQRKILNMFQVILK